MGKAGQVLIKSLAEKVRDCLQIPGEEEQYRSVVEIVEFQDPSDVKAKKSQEWTPSSTEKKVSLRFRTEK